MINKKVCSVVAVVGLVVALFGNDLRTSEDGLLTTANAESCIAQPYKCQADKLTVGIGSTSGTIENRIYSNEEIAQRFAQDIKITETCVNRYFNGQYMGQNQFDAMVDLVFNVGCYNARYLSNGNKTKLSIYALQQDWRNMCEEMQDFYNVNGVKNKGLENRRKINYKQCLKGL